MYICILYQCADTAKLEILGVKFYLYICLQKCALCHLLVPLHFLIASKLSGKTSLPSS